MGKKKGGGVGGRGGGGGGGGGALKKTDQRPSRCPPSAVSAARISAS